MFYVIELSLNNILNRPSCKNEIEGQKLAMNCGKNGMFISVFLEWSDCTPRMGFEIYKGCFWCVWMAFLAVYFEMIIK